MARSIRGPRAAIQISGHFARDGGRSKTALGSGKRGDSREASAPFAVHNARNVARASSKHATGLDQVSGKQSRSGLRRDRWIAAIGLGHAYTESQAADAVVGGEAVRHRAPETPNPEIARVVSPR